MRTVDLRSDRATGSSAPFPISPEGGVMTTRRLSVSRISAVNSGAEPGARRARSAREER